MPSDTPGTPSQPSFAQFLGTDLETVETAPAFDAHAAEKERVHGIVHSWIVQHLHGSPVSRNTEAYNHIRAAVPALVELLVKGQ